MRMLYTILCYNDEDVVWSWSKEEDAAVMAKLGVVQERLTKAGRLGPSVRLLPTTSATTLRRTQDPPLVIDVRSPRRKAASRLLCDRRGQSG